VIEARPQQAGFSLNEKGDNTLCEGAESSVVKWDVALEEQVED